MLGPLLFSIYINGITEISISANSYRVLYADDVLLYRGIAEPKEDLCKVQSIAVEHCILVPSMIFKNIIINLLCLCMSYMLYNCM